MLGITIECYFQNNTCYENDDSLFNIRLAWQLYRDTIYVCVMQRQPEYASLARFRFILRRFLAFSAAEARAAGLEPRQHQLLLSLGALSPKVRPTIGALADQLMIRHHSAVELVSRMEKQGLVRRERDDDDRRVVLVRMERRGRHLLRRLSQAHRHELHTTGPALVAALEKVLETKHSK